MALSATSDDWREKVDATVLEAASVREIAYIVLLNEQADLSEATELRTKLEKGKYVFERLSELAERTQPDIIETLISENVEYQRFWIANMILVKSGLQILEKVARSPAVSAIHANSQLRIDQSAIDPQLPKSQSSPEGIEWNITLVQAPAVWGQGITGQGVIVGGIDTGYEWQHSALIHQYRGSDGEQVDHNYNWHDAVHIKASRCQPDSPEPCDESTVGHGTLTMGIMVGDDGQGNRIGMAPDAKWIGCRCWEPENGTYISYITECLEWMVAPTDLNGDNSDPSKAPHVITNSYLCTAEEGCEALDALEISFNNVRAAGIVVLGGAGNDGPVCSSINLPPAIYKDYFSVGATTSNDSIARLSSRGPVMIDGSDRIKPDVVAPGQDIRSSTIDDSYLEVRGTSFAGPHVAGLVALLLSANPALAGNVDLIEEIIIHTAVPITTSQVCGDTEGTYFPNNTYGYGRIDALAAYELAISASEEVGTTSQNVPGFFTTHNHPNPFNEMTTIKYFMPTPTEVVMKIYDIRGEQIRTIDQGLVKTGLKVIRWDGKDDQGQPMPSGIYFYQIRAGELRQTQKMILLK
ncbi:MAG: S8 family serine peptidase [Fidelibacterota bacterium]|nr:MAG: S8 family serine peptidase [Candidatus Neomarinimicrobiota bacterium]